jgi:signal transduction histidine kinase
VSINLYRIVQESLNNAFKYAQAKKIDIRLTKTETGELQLSVEDDGVGMNVEAVDQVTHFGLLGMRERVQALNGIFNIIASPNHGTRINITVPDSHPNR